MQERLHNRDGTAQAVPSLFMCAGRLYSTCSFPALVDYLYSLRYNISRDRIAVETKGQDSCRNKGQNSCRNKGAG